MLHIRRDLFHDESAVSWCSRLAMLNGCESAREFCLHMGFTFTKVMDGVPSALSSLAALGGVQPDILSGRAIRRANRNYELRGQKLSRGTVRQDCTLVCPECLIQDMGGAPHKDHYLSFGRTEWMVTPLRTCRIHHRALVSICSPADYDFAALFERHHLRFPDLLSASAPRAPSCFETYLHNRLNGICQTSTWMDTMPFHSVVRACEIIGAVGTLGPRVHLTRINDDERWRTGQCGFSLIATGPSGILELLDDLSAGLEEKRRNVGPKRLFGKLYEWLSCPDDPAHTSIREVVSEYVLEKSTVSPGSIVLGKVVTERKFWSASSAAEATCAHPARLRKALEDAGFICEDQRERANRRTHFAADQRAADFLNRFRSAMSGTKAASYIKAPRVQFGLLVKSGHLNPFIRGGTDTLKDHAFARADLDDFLARIMKDATEVADQHASVMDIPSCARVARVGAMAIVGLLLERRLTIVRRHPSRLGYLSVLVNPGEVRNLGFETPPPDRLTLADVVLMSGMSQRAVSGLIKLAYLPSHVVPNNITKIKQRIVMRSDLANFMRKYVSLFIIAKERGYSISSFKIFLDDGGIIPAFTHDQAGVTIYLRASIPPP